MEDLDLVRSLLTHDISIEAAQETDHQPKESLKSAFYRPVSQSPSQPALPLRGSRRVPVTKLVA
jgi:hypothetical protein